MIMRFMDVDPAEVLGSVALPSRLGSEERIRFDGSMSPTIEHGGSFKTVLQQDCEFRGVVNVLATFSRCLVLPFAFQHGITQLRG
jgi:hypothetical protein